MNRIIFPSHRVTVAGMLLLTGLPVHAIEKQQSFPLGLAGNGAGTGFLLQFTVGLVVVLACVVGLAWLMRRIGNIQTSADGALRIIGGLALGTREKLVLVQVGDTQLLVGVAPGRVEAMHVLQEPVTMRENNPEQGSFATRLREAFRAEQQS